MARAMWCACLGWRRSISAPVCGFGPGDRPHSLRLFFFRLPHVEGDGAPPRRTAWIARPEVAPACGRAWACNDTPRALRRANAASSAYASVSDRAAPGAVCPWKVCPDAARGSGLRNHPPAGCRSRSPLSRRLMKTPSTTDLDGHVLTVRLIHCQEQFH